MSLQLQNIRVRLADFVLEIDVELHAHVTALFGPSGAGKTTLLDTIAGLRPPLSAVIRLDGRTLTDTGSRVSVPPHRRAIGYVPQDLALFPHLSVGENLRYGQPPRAEGQGPFSLVQITGLLDLGGLMARRTGQLSGGEKQRVALGRALLSAPRLLLLDEPLASLDTGLKGRILPYLRRIRETFPIPILYVSHDAGEVAALCDEVLTLDGGRITGREPVIR
ncbi:MAG TPA: ATP-binding cassette domain-containing protein [Candidatus Limnocylindria bacterium]|nr:ATP-binding cassette domain-containing protein [Candidatus Limnocylindria bacterium]